MRTALALLVALTLATPAFPSSGYVEGQQVMYVGGTITGLKPGDMGQLDTTREQAIAFQSGEKRVEIPYVSIRSFHYAQRLARRLGVIGTVAVVLVKRRQRRHFVEITFRDEKGTPQVALFEVSKDMAHPVVAVLQARAPQPCASAAKKAAETASEPKACRVQTPPIYIED